MTPLKNWAIVHFVVGLVFLSLMAGIGLPTYSRWMEVEREIKRLENYRGHLRHPLFGDIPLPLSTTVKDIKQERADLALMSFLAFLMGVAGLVFIVNGIKLNHADSLLGETFLRCPFCLADKVVFDVKLYIEYKIICRDCHALWKFHLDVLSMSLTRLWLVDSGNALREEEKNIIPNTDDPEQWRIWAKERFKQERHARPVSLPEQGQTLFCRFCGHPNLPDANFCSACGKKLQA